MNNQDTRFANQYNIQWFPGHMTKTLRMMEQEIQHVDASLVLLDARIPLSSLNPEIERITARKPKLYVLNKADLADPVVTEAWIRYFRAADAGCVAISAKQKGGAKAVQAAIEKELAGLLARRQVRGMGGAKTQVMLCGIPNVGKSTFINTFAGSARAKAADRPGVTKGKQWVSTEKFDLLDMPGVLWKKFDSKTIASNLAFIGSIKDDILDVEELAMNLLDEVRRNYPDLVARRYKLDAETMALPPYELAASAACWCAAARSTPSAVPSCWWMSSAPASGAESRWSARPSGTTLRTLHRRTTNETAFRRRDLRTAVCV